MIGPFNLFRSAELGFTSCPVCGRTQQDYFVMAAWDEGSLTRYACTWCAMKIRQPPVPVSGSATTPAKMKCACGDRIYGGGDECYGCRNARVESERLQAAKRQREKLLDFALSQGALFWSAFEDLRVSMEAQWMLLALLDLAGDGCEVQVSQEKLARHAGLDKPTAHQAAEVLKELVSARLISKFPGRPANAGNVYVIL